MSIALRYLFSRKSQSAINLITVVAAVGIAVITAAMICVLSIYNGFEALMGDLCATVDPDIRMEAQVGKRFRDTPQLRDSILSLPGVQSLSVVLSETVLASYNGRQVPAIVKGIDTLSIDQPGSPNCIIGCNLAAAIGINRGFLRPLTLYSLPDGRIDLYCTDLLQVHEPQYDDQFILTSLPSARLLLGDTLGYASAYELTVTPQFRPADNRTFRFLTRYQQHADDYRVIQIEKLVTWLLITFILLIASFNAVSALAMLIIDKRSHIQTMRTLGASLLSVRITFCYVGWLINGLGMSAGLVIGTIIVLVQQHFGIITLGGGDYANYAIEAYPVRFFFSDAFYTFLTVTLTGIISTTLTVISKLTSGTTRRASARHPQSRPCASSRGCGAWRHQ